MINIKKILSIYIFICVFTLFITSSELNVYAYDYNKINDNTSIENDFELLGIDINDYYQIDIYDDYNKCYVIAMSENYVESTRQIQTYIYIYNPFDTYVDTWFGTDGILFKTLNYTLNGKSNIYEFPTDYFVEENDNRVYKVKTFTYDYCQKSELSINSIEYSVVDDSSVGNTYVSLSDFSLTNYHSILNGFECET